MNLEELNNEGLRALQLGDYLTAEEKFMTCRVQEPNEPIFLYNLALCNYKQGDCETAVNRLYMATSLNRNYSDAWAMLAQCHMDRKFYNDAIHAFSHAETTTPDRKKIQEYLTLASQCYLIQGKIEKGFKNYGLVEGEWNGHCSLIGKKLLIKGTMGLGDQIFFARWLPMVGVLGCEYIVLEVDVALKTLFRCTFSENGFFIVEKGNIPNWFVPDYTISMHRLPAVFKTSMGTIPANPYLYDPEFGTEEISNIGLAWSGNPLHLNDHNRSIPLELLKPIYGNKRFDFYGLQPDLRHSDAEARASIKFIDWITPADNLFDTAEFIDLRVNLVITVDTAVANLAGAMGMPTWVLVPYACDWRWGESGETTPWYPSVRVFRQGEDRRWEPVIKRVAQELEKLNE